MEFILGVIVGIAFTSLVVAIMPRRSDECERCAKLADARGDADSILRHLLAEREKGKK
jgi:uncharacterized membrane protein YgaE (UPF0421/DUF939 family)